MVATNVNNSISECLNYLRSVKGPVKLIDDVSAYEKMRFLEQQVNARENSDLIEWSLFTDNNWPEQLAEILFYLYEISDELNFSVDPIEVARTLDTPNLNNRRKNTLFYSLNILNTILSKSLAFGLKFNQTCGLDALFFMLKDASLCQKILASKINAMFKTICANLNLLSRVCEESLKKWASLDALKILLETIHNFPSAKLTVCQTILYIASDKELENHAEIKSCIEIHVELLEKCASEFRAKNFRREVKEFFADDHSNSIEKHEVHMVKAYEPAGYLTVTSILRAFYRLVLNDKIRVELYFKHDLKHTLKALLFGASLIELKFILNLIAQLSFNDEIRNDFLKDQELVDFIMSNKNEKTYESFLRKLRQQINWNLKEKMVGFNWYPIGKLPQKTYFCLPK